MKQKIKIHKIFKHFFINANNDNIYLDENGMLFQITEYDINGNKILEISYDDEGNVIEKYEYVYNDNNNIVSKIIFFDEEIIAERIVYVRNEKEQIISERLFIKLCQIKKILNLNRIWKKKLIGMSSAKKQQNLFVRANL